MDDLRAKRCLPCEGGVPKLDVAAITELLAAVPAWRVADDRLHRRYLFPHFMDGIRFIDRVAELAEAEGHHPDLAVHYRQVDVTIWTHAVGGLTENDFILAAKIDAL
jgi:4a-hydroxytetrahydrobiopterin dehydratase